MDSCNERALTLWAKTSPYHPLWCHLLDVGAVSTALARTSGDVDGLGRRWLAFLASMHDIGKADPRFQSQDPELADELSRLGLEFPDHRESFRHEARSADWTGEYLTTECGWSARAVRVAESVLRGHHGNFTATCLSSEGRHSGQWRDIRKWLGAKVTETIGLAGEPPPPDFADASATGLKLAGLIVLSDWIASNEEIFRYPSLNRSAAPCDYWREALTEAGGALVRLGLDRPPCARASTPTFADLWPDIATLKPSQRALDRACSDGVPAGLAIIEAPMGEGKTESAIYLSEYWRSVTDISGAYFALPTMATSNQMHSRYNEFLARYRPDAGGPRLVHGMAWLMDHTTPECDTEVHGEESEEESLLALDWFRPSKRALIAPEGVGTIDQALTAALNVKHGFLRLLGLSSKVLIIDEVHAYDEYMTTILERLLQWCRTLRIPVILLSATLSHRQKDRLVSAYGGNLPACDPAGEAYPLITFAPLEGDVHVLPVEAQPERRIALHSHEGLLDKPRETAQLVKDLVEHGGCACVLVNTVKHAQDVFEQLEKVDEGGEHYLFHARFPAWRRNEIEKQVVELFGKNGMGEGKRPRRAVLVATQVVENSIDLDFDVMVSQLAPVDLLLQRAGRLWRHRDIGIPRYGLGDALHVLVPETGLDVYGSSKAVYGQSALLRTRRLLDGYTVLALPHDFRPLIEGCYGDGCVFADIGADAERDRKRDLDASKAAVGLIYPPDAEEFSIASMTGKTLNESEDTSQSYLYASTRLDRDSCSVLILEDTELIEASRSPKRPERSMLEKLYLHKVSIPAHWLAGVCSAGGSSAPDAPRWLRGVKVIPMKKGIWRGSRKDGPMSLEFDSLLGVRMTRDVPE